MSRVGKLPIDVPNDINIELNDNVVKFVKGSISKEYFFGDDFSVEYKNNLLKIHPKDSTKKNIDNFYGLHRKNIFNIVKGLIEPFSVILEINGVGFKAIVKNNILILYLGYSHSIAFALPSEVTAKVEENRIILNSIDKQLVGQVASKIISLRKPEPYKGKGVKIFNKPILRKEGKKK